MRTKKTVVILISGVAGSGKTTAKNHLLEELKKLDGIDSAGYSFANPIKYIAQAFIGWNMEKDSAGRKLLQNLGKDGREYDRNIWVKHMFNQMDKANKKAGGLFPVHFYIVDDWRFPNELDYISKNPIIDVVTIRIFGRGGLNGDAASDVSETSLAEMDNEFLQLDEDCFYNFSVENSDSVELLKNKLDIVLAEICKKFIV